MRKILGLFALAGLGLFFYKKIQETKKLETAKIVK